MILCCGEALIDMIPEAVVSGAEGFVPHRGGAIYNTAIALGRLGASVGMLTGLSTDMFGTQLRAGLADAGVAADLVITSTRPTTLAFVKLVNGQASYLFYDENSAGRMVQADQMPVLPDEISTLYFGGISLACDPGADAYAALLAREGAARAVMIDPNIRSAFIEDEAAYRARLNTMIGGADIVKVSDEDLHWIVPGTQTLEQKAQVLSDLGPRLVILTKGSEGVTGFLRGADAIHVPSEKVDVVDTVGAGDTFNAGVLAALSKDTPLTKQKIAVLTPETTRSALAFGTKVAAVTVSRRGANPPWAKELH